jgi:mannose-6-phosphate isomerase-like protein (cupin superfamily)
LGQNKEEVMDMYPGDVVVIPSNLPHEVLMIGDVEEVDTLGSAKTGLA